MEAKEVTSQVGFGVGTLVLDLFIPMIPPKWGIAWGKTNFLSTAIVERISPITYPLFKLRTSEKEWAFLISFSASAGGINC